MARRIRAREVLRLRSVNGLSQNAIARTAHVSKHSVQDVLEAARERGVSWEDVEGMSEEAAYALLFPGRGDAGPVHADPDWARVHRELARTGVTLKLLHAEYADGCAEAGAPSMSYDRFCKRYRQYTVSRNVVSRVGHKAGRNMEVDWSGPTMRLVDPATGEVRKVYLFVACLPFSRYSYVEPTLDMKQDTWLLCHVHAFSFLGGATPCIVPDNLRTGVGLATLMWTVPGGAQETGGPYMRDPRHPRHFTDEFKRQIVDLYNAGKPKREIMDEYDLGKSTVERWIKSINATGSPRAACNRTPEQNRILELERENRRLRMEVDVLKQAALIYARK